MRFNKHVYQVKELAKRGEVGERMKQRRRRKQSRKWRKKRKKKAKTTMCLARWETAFSNKCRHFYWVFSFQLPIAKQVWSIQLDLIWLGWFLTQGGKRPGWQTPDWKTTRWNYQVKYRLSGKSVNRSHILLCISIASILYRIVLWTIWAIFIKRNHYLDSDSSGYSVFVFSAWQLYSYPTQCHGVRPCRFGRMHISGQGATANISNSLHASNWRNKICPQVNFP